MPSKISGTPIATFNGLKIYAKLQKAKKKGKDRIWINIRQDDPKQQRIAPTLSYVNAIDVCFSRAKKGLPTHP